MRSSNFLRLIRRIFRLPELFCTREFHNGILRRNHHICPSARILAVPFFHLTGVAVFNPEKPDGELELLRTALSLDHTLFTVQRHTSRPKGYVRVDFYASKAAGGPGLTRITSLVAGVLKYRRSRCGLILNDREDVDYDVLAALSSKLKLDLKHERLNSNSRSCPVLFF